MPGSRKKTGDANPPHAHGSEVRQGSGNQSSHTITTVLLALEPSYSAQLRPTRRPGLPGVGTRGWSASRPPRRGGAGNADTTSREGRGGGGGIASQELRSFPVAGPPLLRHPSHVTGSAGSAHAEGRGLCLGAGPVRDDWHPRKPKEESAASTEYQK